MQLIKDFYRGDSFTITVDPSVYSISDATGVTIAISSGITDCNVVNTITLLSDNNVYSYAFTMDDTDSYDIGNYTYSVRITTEQQSRVVGVYTFTVFDINANPVTPVIEEISRLETVRKNLYNKLEKLSSTVYASYGRDGSTATLTAQAEVRRELVFITNRITKLKARLIRPSDNSKNVSWRINDY